MAVLLLSACGPCKRRSQTCLLKVLEISPEVLLGLFVAFEGQSAVSEIGYFALLLRKEGSAFKSNMPSIFHCRRHGVVYFHLWFTYGLPWVTGVGCLNIFANFRRVSLRLMVQWEIEHRVK